MSLKALSSTLLYALALVVGKGISFIMLPIVTGHLSPSEYGVLELLVSVADVASLLLGLGLADALFRFGKDSTTSGTLLSFGLLFGGGMLAVGQLIAPSLASLLPGQIDTLDLRILMATLALTTAIQVPLAYLRFRDRPGLFAAVSIGKALLQAALVALLLTMEFGVTGVLLGGLIADAVASALLVILHVRDTGWSLDGAALRRVLPYGLPLVVSGFFGFCLGSFDRWFLAESVSSADLALYGLAAKFGLLAAFALQPFEMWWYPRRLRLLESAEGRIESANRVALGIAWSAVAVSAVAVLGPVAIGWLTPESYHAAGEWVPWLALIAFLHAATNLMNVGCYAGHTTWLPMSINGGAAAVAVVGYATLIPAYGVTGTIVATLIAQGLRLLIFTVASQRLAPLPHRYLVLLTVPLVAAAGVVLSIQSGAWLLIPLGPLAATAVALMLGVVSWPSAKDSQ